MLPENPCYDSGYVLMEPNSILVINTTHWLSPKILSLIFIHQLKQVRLQLLHNRVVHSRSEILYIADASAHDTSFMS